MISKTTPRGQTPVWPLNPCPTHSAEAVGDPSWGPILLFVRTYLSMERQSGQRVSSHSLMPDGTFSLQVGAHRREGIKGAFSKTVSQKTTPWSPHGDVETATLPGDPALPTPL